jgi:hypothetical protein
MGNSLVGQLFSRHESNSNEEVEHFFSGDWLNRASSAVNTDPQEPEPVGYTLFRVHEFLHAFIYSQVTRHKGNELD